MKNVEIFTDGACKGNPGPGGWGTILRFGEHEKELSGGERRRVCAARALAGMPEVVFADEPTSDLDDENMHAVLSLLRKAADAGAAVMIVTHDIEALDYADVKNRMDEGRLLKG